MTDAAATDGGTVAAAPGRIPSEMAADVVGAWAELSNVAKLRQVDAGRGGRYTYADLADVLDVVRPVLARHHLALLQPLSRDGEPTITIHTLLVHSSGHVLEWLFQVQSGATAQATGSALTYGRRYALTAALGVAAGGDDDGAAASAAPHVPESFDDAQPGPSAVQTKRVVHLFDTLDIVLQKERREVMAAILDAPERTWAELRPDERLTVITALAERVEEQERQTAGVASGLFGDE